MKCKVYVETLSDGSHVWNVALMDGKRLVEMFHCISESDAYEFASKLDELIKVYTVD